MDRLDYLDQLETVAVRAYLRCYCPTGTKVDDLSVQERFYVQKGIEVMRYAVAEELVSGSLVANQVH